MSTGLNDRKEIVVYYPIHASGTPIQPTTGQAPPKKEKGELISIQLIAKHDLSLAAG
jgi:hypothetical protein